ncbi:MAG: MtrAB system histidine kinase MtrB, partial [Dermatophilaceae bacterium]
MSPARERSDTPRAAVAAGARALVGAGRAMRDCAVRSVRWMLHWWRASLQVRIVTTTVLLCLLVMGLLQAFVYLRIADGLVQDRIATAQEEAVVGAQDVQKRLDTIDKTDAATVRQAVFDTIRQEATARGEDSREVIMIRALSNTTSQLVLPAMDTGLDASIIPQDIREQLAAEPAYEHYKIISVPLADGNVSRVVFGGLVSVPEAGQYELYFVYPMERQEQILSMVRSTFLLGLAIFAALIGLVAHVVTRLAVDPVREAAVVAQRLAKGRLNERLIVKGEDDLAKLGTAFNAMANTLQTQISKLEDLSVVQQRFVSDVSHELRTPLTTIRMAAEVIHDDRDAFPPVSRRSAEILRDEVERFDSLLADLLEISRFDAGAANLDRESVDVRDVVERVLRSTQELARHKKVTVELVGADDPLKAELDPRRVERIVRNLVVNALEHGENRPVRIELGGNDEAIAVAVRDRGIGLQPGEADLIFTRFWRADRARKRTTGGTGLGLAIALEDARLHDGWLQAWSVPGEGCRLRLTLPRVAGRPIGYSPLPLADPAPETAAGEGTAPVGEPIAATSEPVRATAERVGAAVPAQLDAVVPDAVVPDAVVPDAV